MDLALMRPWVGVLVFFCMTMVCSVSEDSCIANVKFQPDTMMRMVQVTLIKGNILQSMVEKAMKNGDNSKMIKGIKGLKIADLNIPSIIIILHPPDKICIMLTTNITVSGKSFIGGQMQITVVTLSEMCGTISKSPEGSVIIKVTKCTVVVKSCKTNLPSSMLPKIVNKFLDSTLGKVMPGVLCPAADMIMEKQMQAFKEMLEKKPIGSVGYVAYEVAENPTVHTTYININLKLKIEKKNGELIPFECEPVPNDLPSNNEKMSVVYLPGGALNAYMILVQAQLNSIVTKVKNIVPTSDQLKKILPNINLPAGKKLKVKITHQENSKVTVSSSDNYITTNIEASFLDVKRGNQLLSITMKHQCSVSFTIKQDHLVLSLKAGSCRTLEVSSPAGDVTGATKYTETVMDSWMPAANDVLNKNQVPLPNIRNAMSTTEDPTLSFGENVVIMQTNVQPYAVAEMADELKKQCNQIKI